jgi:septal ring factor EnvC (AmiA/AmiB activator)
VKNAGFSALLAIAAGLLAFAPVFLYAEMQEEVRDYKAHLERTKSELDSVKEEIRVERDNLNREKYKEKATTKYIQRLEKEITLTHKELDVFKNNITVLESGVNELNARIEKTENSRKDTEAAVMAALRRQYEKTDSAYLRFLFKSSSLSEFIKRYKFIKILSSKSAELMEQYRMILEQLQSDRETLLNYKAQLDSVKSSKEQEWKRYKNETWQKMVLLKNIQSNIKEKNRMLKDLEISAKKLTRFIESLETTAELSDKDAQTAFKESKGKFPWPVDGGTILAYFGKFKHPKFKTIVENRGIHIGDKYGAPVYSVLGGIIKYADWFEGYGKMIVIYHGGNYYTIYAHLSDITVSVNQKVAVRQQIGSVGDTESFYGDELYFEMRKKGEPVNPLYYLGKR